MKTYRPTSNGRRQMSVVNYGEFITASKPFKKLAKGKKRNSGRNNYGRVTSSYRGGGHKKLFRNIDFFYDKKDVPAKIETIEYDPFRTGFIALVLYKDGERRYVVVPKEMKVGDEFIVSENAPIKIGNRLMVKNVHIGTFLYNVELKAGGGSKIARSAGNYVEVVAQDAPMTHLKMPSTEIRKVPQHAWASIGAVSNDENRLVNIGKAGRSRWMGRRPKVRGSAKNPVDHPYGGGEQKAGRGRRRAITRTGKPVGKGQKSRRAKKYSNIFIISRRKVGKKR